jgi:hypothetical protein
MSQSLQDVLDAARQLPPDELRRLVEQLVAEVRSAGPAPKRSASGARLRSSRRHTARSRGWTARL